MRQLGACTWKRHNPKLTHGAGRRLAVRVSGAIFLLALSPVFAQTYADNIPLDHPAIHYSAGPFDNAVTRLQSQLDSGKVQLDFAEGAGYLSSLLQHLGVNVDSQALVFSKTSFQSQKISPRNPRAVYFADDIAVGYVRGGELLELAATDPRQ